MKSIFTVIKFTMKDMLGRKSFRISTLIILVLIVLGVNIPNVITAFGGEGLENTVLITDKSNVFDGKLEALNDTDLGYKIETSTDDYETIKQKINDGEIDQAIIVNQTKDGADLHYLVKNVALSNGIPKDLSNALTAFYTSLQLQKLNLSPNQLQSLSPNFNFTLEQTGEEEIHGNIFVLMILSIVLFYAIYFCAYQVSSSITTEKTSKIMETLVTSTSPSTIVLGKTIGIGLVGLLQMVLFIGTALITANLCLDHEMLASILDLSSITPMLGLISMLYFILGYSVYALLYALTGSTVSKPEDIQSANTPIALLTMVGFYLAYFTLTDPTSNLNLFAAIFPFSSPFCMPIRFMTGLATPTEILISLAVMIVTILIVARVAIKIYSNAILNYGAKMSWREIIKSYKEK